MLPKKNPLSKLERGMMPNVLVDTPPREKLTESMSILMFDRFK
jgi:hypothetical protein